MKTVFKSLTNKEALTANNTRFIAHCANCFNTMGSGVAAAIRKDFPYAAWADNKTQAGLRTKCGDYTIGIPDHDLDRAGLINPIVFNLYGQYTMGSHQRQVNYEWLFNALSKMAEHVDQTVTFYNTHFTVGFPHKMGCGLAGGNWNVVKILIEEAFKEYNLEERILIYDIDNMPNSKIS